MSSKYHIHTAPAAPRFAPVAKLAAMEVEGCLGCQVCVKRSSCVYDVYKQRSFDPDQIVDTADNICISCMRCVQECKKAILSRVPNPLFDRMGDDYWKPELIASIWKQAENGSIPVSGAGYRGPFSGPGFDSMWTDMSEIVRPTRDGIHGREYISTVIELGRRPDRLEFDANGELLTELPPFRELPIPIVLDARTRPFVSEATRRSIAQAAQALQTMSTASFEDAQECLKEQRSHLIVQFDPVHDDPALLAGIPVVELADVEDVLDTIERVKTSNPDIVTSIRLPLNKVAPQRAAALARGGAEVIHLQAGPDGQSENGFIIECVKDIHGELIAQSVRDQVTLLLSGGIAMAEHVAKIIACGADGVGLDLAILAALECRLCDDCEERTRCPIDLDKVSIDWAAQRVTNLVGSWHSQLIEVMGAMGLREVRRLRGELGRVMFFEDLERDSFAPLFGHRLETTPTRPHTQPPTPTSEKHSLAEDCPTRFRNQLSKFKVVRTSACIQCGKCADICQYGVHVKAGERMLAPKSYLCRSAETCRSENAFCGDACPGDAIRVGMDPSWKSFGDPRWCPELIVSTWDQAATGKPPDNGLEYRIGASCGGFDRMTISVPDTAATTTDAEVNLRIPINRRHDGRPAISIGIPFYGGGMSYGSVSLTTMLARARAYEKFDSFTCTGEGGYPDELAPHADHVITQVATGLFGVREETIQRSPMVEFKYAQGAKPGLGGHLLGDKVTPAVAAIREAVVGSALFSPFPFHSVYSIEDHKKHVDWIKAVSPTTLVSVKVSTANDVDMVAVGSYYAGAHVIHIDGSYGGTGAAPDIAKKNIAMPLEYAIPKVHQFLKDEGVRDEMTLIVSGGIRSAWDLAKAIALGADGCVIGTAELVALECIRCGVCESGRGCPRGIATTDPDLSLIYDVDWASQRLINLFSSWTLELRSILAGLGMTCVTELVGRSDVLEHLDYERAT